MRALLPVLLMLGASVLGACAPAVQGPGAQTAWRGAASEAGVVLARGGQALLWPPGAAPNTPPRAVNLPAAVADVAWHAGRPWAALPALGLVLPLTGSADPVQAGAAVRLSSLAIYRQDGSALDYQGAAAAGLPGNPAAVLSAPDGHDYGLVAGAVYRAGERTARLRVSDASGSFLYWDREIRLSPLPAVGTPGGVFVLHPDALELRRGSSAGRLTLPPELRGGGLAAAPGGALVWGAGGAWRVIRYHEL